MTCPCSQTTDFGDKKRKAVWLIFYEDGMPCEAMIVDAISPNKVANYWHHIE